LQQQQQQQQQYGRSQPSAYTSGPSSASSNGYGFIMIPTLGRRNKTNNQANNSEATTPKTPRTPFLFRNPFSARTPAAPTAAPSAYPYNDPQNTPTLGGMAGQPPLTALSTHHYNISNQPLTPGVPVIYPTGSNPGVTISGSNAGGGAYAGLVYPPYSTPPQSGIAIATGLTRSNSGSTVNYVTASGQNAVAQSPVPSIGVGHQRSASHHVFQGQGGRSGSVSIHDEAQQQYQSGGSYHHHHHHAPMVPTPSSSSTRSNPLSPPHTGMHSRSPTPPLPQGNHHLFMSQLQSSSTTANSTTTAPQVLRSTPTPTPPIGGGGVVIPTAPVPSRGSITSPVRSVTPTNQQQQSSSSSSSMLDSSLLSSSLFSDWNAAFSSAGFSSSFQQDAGSGNTITSNTTSTGGGKLYENAADSSITLVSSSNNSINNNTTTKSISGSGPTSTTLTSSAASSSSSITSPSITSSSKGGNGGGNGGGSKRDSIPFDQDIFETYALIAAGMGISFADEGAAAVTTSKDRSTSLAWTDGAGKKR
ncbi:hypothetical protein HDU76_003707, partial [Blyttiomyces sp. JEL0837]